MKTICAWLAEDAGITLGVTRLTSYVEKSRLYHVCRDLFEQLAQTPFA